METIGSPETSVSNHRTPHNNPEDGRINFNRGGSLLSLKFLAVLRVYTYIRYSDRQTVALQII
jgi:hypothetical protein